MRSLFAVLILFSSVVSAAEFLGVIDANQDGIPDIFVFNHRGTELYCVSIQETEDFHRAVCHDEAGNRLEFQAVPAEEGWLKEI